MKLDLDELIVALASAPGSASRGIIRISGSEVHSVIEKWFQPFHESLWASISRAKRISGQLHLERERCIVPVDLMFWPTSQSYTGQPILELHLPGSPPLLEAVLVELVSRGARAARPGEFTLRAFLAGRIDLLQAEAVLGVIDANDHVELQSALGQLAGGLSQPLNALRLDLIDLLADIEAGLDFIEEDIEFVERHEITRRIAIARQVFEQLLEQSRSRMTSHTRRRVVLAGLPNAGKSTLFNRLCSEEFQSTIGSWSEETRNISANAALVSSIEGTTRDFLVSQVKWQSFEFDLVDTAGWEFDATEIDAIAQSKREEQLRSADLVIWCTASDLIESRRSRDDRCFELASKLAGRICRIRTCSDRIAGHSSAVEETDELFLSAVSGEGVLELIRQIVDSLVSANADQRSWLGMTAARCQESLSGVVDALAKAQALSANGMVGDELLAVDLREALDHLGAILGVTYADDILDRVFGKFCIGK